MHWLILIVAGLLGVRWAVGLKYTNGFSRWLPSVVTVSVLMGSVLLLSIAMRSLPVGTSYAVWTGIGTIGTVLCGIWIFNEPTTPPRLFCLALIVAGNWPAANRPVDPGRDGRLILGLAASR